MMPTFAITQKKFTRTIRLELDEAWLTKPISINTPKFKLDGISDFECFFICETTVSTTFPREHQVELYLRYTIVNRSMKNSKFGDYISYEIVTTPSNRGMARRWKTPINCNDLRCIINGTVTFVITVTYAPPYCINNDVSSCNIKLLPHEIMPFDEQSCDLKIVAEKKFIRVHKAYLSLISPVFAAMFTHNTIEAQTGTIQITDFDYATVKTAIDMLYGHPFEPHFLQDVIAVTRFAEKYMIQTAVDRLETWLAGNITIDNFGAIVEYAWTHSCDKLKRLCANFYRQRVYPVFPFIDPVISAEMIQLLD